MALLVLKDTQQCSLAIAPINAKGRPAPVDGVPQWATSDPNVATITPSANGMSAVVKANFAGTAQVSVTCDADLGTGKRNITGTLDVRVDAGEAVSVAITPGTPAEQ